jgi:hypothetical protein
MDEEDRDIFEPPTEHKRVLIISKESFDYTKESLEEELRQIKSAVRKLNRIDPVKYRTNLE